MIPTDRARRLVEALHDVQSNEKAWEIVDDAFREVRASVEQQVVIQSDEGANIRYRASSCPQCGASYDPKTGRWTMPLAGWSRRDEIAREIWSQLLAREFANISIIAQENEESAATLVGDLAKAAVTYADVLIEALDRRE